jgi:CheY-like chemotaxis protein
MTTDEIVSALPVTFVDQVRDGLLLLHEPAGLQRHPLAALAEAAAATPAPRGQALRRALLDAIETLHPSVEVAPGARAWRIYRILELRYLDGYDVADVAEQVALSRSQYHRQQQRAIQAVAAVLWEQWQGHAAVNAGASSSLARHVAADLVPGGVSPVDLREVLVGLCDLLTPLRAHHGVGLRLDLPDRPLLVLGERVALRQALLAVLADAISRSSRDGVQVTVAASPGQIEVVVGGIVATSGSALLESITEARPFVAALHGDVRCLPPVAAAGGWQVALAFPAPERPTLLVVDNHPDFIRLVERYVTGQRWQIVGAASVAVAVEQAHRHRPQAVLLDVVIPERDGWELLLELKANPVTRPIPVVVCSVLNEPAVAISLGAAAYLHKPIARAELLTTLAALPSAAPTDTGAVVAGRQVGSRLSPAALPVESLPASQE